MEAPDEEDPEFIMVTGERLPCHGLFFVRSMLCGEKLGSSKAKEAGTGPVHFMPCCCLRLPICREGEGRSPERHPGPRGRPGLGEGLDAQAVLQVGRCRSSASTPLLLLSRHHASRMDAYTSSWLAT